MVLPWSAAHTSGKSRHCIWEQSCSGRTRSRTCCSLRAELPPAEPRLGGLAAASRRCGLEMISSRPWGALKRAIGGQHVWDVVEMFGQLVRCGVGIKEFSDTSEAERNSAENVCLGELLDFIKCKQSLFTLLQLSCWGQSENTQLVSC